MVKILPHSAAEFYEKSSDPLFHVAGLQHHGTDDYIYHLIMVLGVKPPQNKRKLTLNLMVVLEEKSGHQQSHEDSWADTEYQA